MIRELRGLRRGEGITLDKFDDTPTLVELGRTDQAISGGSSVEPHAYTYIFLTNTLAEFHGRNVDALRAACGIDFSAAPNTLTKRREKFIGDHGHIATPGTVERWENKAIKALAIRLLGHVGGHAPGTIIRRTPELTMPESPWILELSDLTFILGPDRTVEEVHYVKVIRAHDDGVDSYGIPVIYYSDPGAVFRFDAWTGCEFDGSSKNLDKTVGRFRFRRPLKANEQHRFTFRILVDSEEPMIPVAATHARSNGGAIIVRVQFSEKAPPQGPLYFFSGIPFDDMPGKPTPETTVELDSHLYVERAFENLERQLNYGWGWTW